MYIFTTTEAASWLNITDLLPYTKYHFNITTQLNRTSNPDVWSESTNATVTTLEASRYYLLASNRSCVVVVSNGSSLIAEPIIVY